MLVECKICEAVIDAERLRGYEAPDEFDSEVQYRYSFLKCPKCKSPILASQLRVEGDKEWTDPCRIYPPQDKQVNQSFPRPIKNTYQEALLCYKAKAYTASVIMCRKTLEEICKEHGINSKKDLYTDLRKMKEKGIIESRLFEWAEALRNLGNEAAHDNVTISSQDAKDIIEFTNALLEYVFTFNDKFNEFNKRRQSIKP